VKHNKPERHETLHLTPLILLPFSYDQNISYSPIRPRYFAAISFRRCSHTINYSVKTQATNPQPPQNYSSNPGSLPRFFRNLATHLHWPAPNEQLTGQPDPKNETTTPHPHFNCNEVSEVFVLSGGVMAVCFPTRKCATWPAG
jgi:hypothetical protein